jgi:hypothetical protein
VSAKPAWIFISLLGIITLCWSVYRDVQHEKQYTGDLRNRVVGARLIKDGKSPYFYKWKARDGLRYYDPDAFDSSTFSNITATPFFHHLMAPLIEFPQKKISIYWLVIQYIMLLITVILFFGAASDAVRKCLVVITASLFLLTDGWQMSIGNGQNYLCIPFLATLFYFALQQHKNVCWAFITAIIAISLVLIRPNSMVFFVPYLLLVKKFPRKYLLALSVPLVLLIVWLALSRQERFLWNDYERQVLLQIKMHQGLKVPVQHNEMGPQYAYWEGIDTIATANNALRHPIKQHSENGNFFVVFNKLFKTKLSLITINFLSAIALLLLTCIFYFRKWKGDFSIQQIAIMGFCLYMVSDLFSPVYRHQYYTVQWMFPLLLAIGYCRPSGKWYYLLIWIGLLLNCVNLNFLKLEHTIGEYLWLISFIALSFISKIEPGGLASETTLLETSPD